MEKAKRADLEKELEEQQIAEAKRLRLEAESIRRK